MLKNWIYDIETYPNIFTFCCVFENGKGMRTFEISTRKNEIEDFLTFLRNIVAHKHSLVGFNNEGFDYPVIHYILEKSVKARKNKISLKIEAKEIYRVAMEIIKSEDKFKSIREEDKMIRQIDLFKIHHFDNKARITSLKMLEARMKSESVEDLPFDVGKELTDEEMDILIQYNKHDVTETLKFYNHSIPAIEFREKLTEKYGFDCTNFNDTKIGKQYFINELEKQIPGVCYKQIGKRKIINQTKRDSINVGEILFPYLEFKRPETNAIKKWFASQLITETKGVFSDILESDLGDVAKYAEMVTKRKKLSDPVDKKNKHYVPSEETINELRKQQPMGWIEEKELKSPKGAKSYYWCYNEVETVNIIINGFRFDFGTGGIHGSIDSKIVRSGNGKKIKDIDVSSMYPNIGISNRVYPLHLTANFCDIYEDVYKERKKYGKKTPENAVMKLALNGVYGDSNNEYSPFYDPQYTMTITINGQLSILMLAERLIDIEGVELIQVNTDGVTLLYPEEKEHLISVTCKLWEKDVKLELEYADYEAMFIRDVNNYIALKTDGSVKRKGAYEYEDLGWHQDHSALVIKKAAEHELLGRGTVEEFISAHKDKWDFILHTKVPRSSRLVMVMPDGNEILQQNICRYYPSIGGGKLVKIMPALEGKEEERRIGIDKEYNVKICNKIVDFDWEVDYNYYINEARKLVDPLLI